MKPSQFVLSDSDRRWHSLSSDDQLSWTKELTVCWPGRRWQRLFDGDVVCGASTTRTQNSNNEDCIGRRAWPMEFAHHHRPCISAAMMGQLHSLLTGQAYTRRPWACVSKYNLVRYSCSKVYVRIENGWKNCKQMSSTRRMNTKAVVCNPRRVNVYDLWQTKLGECTLAQCHQSWLSAT